MDLRISRLGLLGSMNWAITWYHPGGETPASIARKLLNVFAGREHRYPLSDAVHRSSARR
jgi:hypothetical protein